MQIAYLLLSSEIRAFEKEKVSRVAEPPTAPGLSPIPFDLGLFHEGCPCVSPHLGMESDIHSTGRSNNDRSSFLTACHV